MEPLRLFFTGLKFAKSKIREGRSWLEGDTSKSAEKIVVLKMSVIIDVVHDCR